MYHYEDEMMMWTLSPHKQFTIFRLGTLNYPSPQLERAE